MDSSDYERMLKAAKVCEQGGDLDAALEWCKRALATGHQPDPSLFLWVEGLEKRRREQANERAEALRRQEARERYKQSIARARTELALGSYPLAKAAYDQAAEADPDGSELPELAQAIARILKPLAPEPTKQTVPDDPPDRSGPIEKTPDDVLRAVMDRARALAAGGERQKAIEALQQLAEEWKGTPWEKEARALIDQIRMGVPQNPVPVEETLPPIPEPSGSGKGGGESPEKGTSASLQDLIRENLSQDQIESHGGLGGVEAALARNLDVFLRSDYYRNPASAWGEAPARSGARDRLVEAMRKGSLEERHIRACLSDAAEAYRKARGISTRDAQNLAVAQANANREEHAHALQEHLIELEGQRLLWEIFAARLVLTAIEGDAGAGSLLRSTSAKDRPEQASYLGDFLRRRYGNEYTEPMVLGGFLAGIRSGG